MNILLLLFALWWSPVQAGTEAFLIQINDRSVVVKAPEVKKKLFSIIVENNSLSDQVGKFVIKGETLKFISVKAGKSETVEVENKSNNNLVFIPVSPSLQDVELVFGKKEYEIPPK